MRFGTVTLLFVTGALGDGCAISGASTATRNAGSAVAFGAPSGLSPARATASPARRRAERPSFRSVAMAGAPIDSTRPTSPAVGDTVAKGPGAAATASTPASASAAGALAGSGPHVTQAMGLTGEGPRASSARSMANPADVSGVWIWEHRGPVPTGDEKQEREEWHLDQQGERLSGYYDRVVREISTDGHAFRCSMGLEFEIATRYRIRGEVRGNQVLIYESSFEVLSPSACDNGQRRLDAYEGLATDDEVRLAWGVGAQVLRRPRPDVPTQHF
jgi:hypothetical protein